MNENKVTGKIEFPEKTQIPASARVHVRLVDTTLQDANSKLVAETVMDNVSEEVNRGKPLYFSLQAPVTIANCDYSVEVHVDVSGDSTDLFQAGDYLNARSHLVLTYGRPNQVEIQLRRI